MKRVFVLAILLVMLFPITNSFAYDGGLLEGKPLYINSTPIYVITDNDLKTSYWWNGVGTFEHVFDEPVVLDSFFISASSCCNGYSIEFYGVDGNLKFSSIATSGHNKINTKEPIKKIVFFANYGNGATYYEFDVYEYIETPAPPYGLTLTSDVGKVILSWEHIQHGSVGLNYNIYRNGELYLSGISGNSYEILTEPEVNYAYYVTAVKQTKESPKSNTVIGMSYPPLQDLNLRYTNLTYNSVRLNFDDIASEYEIYLNDEYLGKTIFNFYDLSKLLDSTTYRVKVVARDRFYRQVYDEIEFTTMKMQLDKTIVNIKDVTYNSATITWQSVQNANEYLLYLNDDLLYKGAGLSFTLSNLEPSTLYSVKVVARNDDVESDRTVSFRTKDIPLPSIDSAILKPSLEPTKRNLVYTHSNGVESVKVYVGGEFVGEYPVNEIIDIDVSDITEKFIDLRLEPIPEGKAYEGKSLVNGTGFELDQPIAEMVSVFDVLRKSFLYIAIASLVIVILVILFFWLRYKFKQNIGGEKFNGATVSGFGLDFPEKKIHARLYHNKNNGFGLENHRDEYIPRYRRKKGFRRFEKFSFLGSSGRVKRKSDITYEKDGVYKRRYVRGKEKHYLAKDIANKKLMKNNMQKFNKVLGVKRQGK